MKARKIMLEYGVPLPPDNVYCSICEKKATPKISVVYHAYDTLGDLRFLLEAKYKCPHFPHSLGVVITLTCQRVCGVLGAWTWPVYSGLY